jgi:hypothetical protein
LIKNFFFTLTFYKKKNKVINCLFFLILCIIFGGVFNLWSAIIIMSIRNNDK